MRILYVNPWFDPALVEGRRIHIEELVTHLARRGHEIWLPYGSPATVGKRLSRNPFVRLLQVARMDIFYLRMEGAPLELPVWLSRGWRFLRRGKIVWEINAASDYIALKSGTPMTHECSRLDAILSLQAADVALAICNTRGLADYARSLGVGSACTIPLGANPDRIDAIAADPDRWRVDQKCLNVMWCGNSTVPWHDLDTLVAAAVRLRDDRRIRFHIVGVPPGASYPDNMISYGRLSYGDTISLMKCMGVGLALYKAPTWSRYGVFSSPLKMFEYMAAGLVVVASPIEQVVDAVRDGVTGFVVPYGDVDAVCMRLTSIADMPQSLVAIRLAGEELVRAMFNWDRVARDTERALLHLCPDESTAIPDGDECD